MSDKGICISEERYVELLNTEQKHKALVEAASLADLTYGDVEGLLKENERLQEKYDRLLSEAALVSWIWHDQHDGIFPVDDLGDAIIGLSVTDEALAEWDGGDEYTWED